MVLYVNRCDIKDHSSALTKQYPFGNKTLMFGTNVLTSAKAIKQSANLLDQNLSNSNQNLSNCSTNNLNRKFSERSKINKLPIPTSKQK